MRLLKIMSAWFLNLLPLKNSAGVFPSAFADKCILIIEDDADSLEATRRVLQRRQFRTLCCTNGEDGLKMVNENKPDMVILDSKLPGIQGPDVCRRIKQDEKSKDTPVIFLTVVSTADNIVNSFDYGADNYLIKPVPPSKLIFHIEEIFRGIKK